MQLEIRELQVFDYSMLKRLREHDRHEARVFYLAETYEDLKLLAEETLITSVEAHGVYINGTLEGIFGVSGPVESDIWGTYYIPWFFGTSVLEEVMGITVARTSKEVVEEWFDKYPALINYATATYNTWKWLTWLGFTVYIKRDVEGNPDTLHFYYTKHN